MLSTKIKSLMDRLDKRTLDMLALSIGAFGIFYLIWKYSSLIGKDLTFKYFWLAGRLWSGGMSPYGADYQHVGESLFETFNGQPFYYPPNWWPVSGFMALFDYATATEIWRLINVMAIVGGTFLLRAALKRADINLSTPALVLYTGLVGLMQSTIIILQQGQSTGLVYFGLCLAIYATLYSKHFLLGLGMAIMLLKPQIGIPIFFGFFLLKQNYKSVFYTIALTFIMMLPGFISLGFFETLFSFLAGLSEHSQFLSNSAKLSTGFKNIVYLIVNRDISSSLATLLSLIGVWGAAIYLQKIVYEKFDGDGPAKLCLYYMAVIFATLFFAPVHDYDMILVAPVLLLGAVLGTARQMLLAVPFLLLVRAGNIGDLFGPTTVDEARFYGSVVSTVALIIMVAIFVIISRQED
ncbi:MAG: DUF2029 domain-containing protein [Alphaproteobacteria bacterium]|nr:DUF2029 domain-containing protein [Alphaproteobacteria bacterium]HPF46434.1 hypothetical protein [Emcibacteraceae bacterium]